MRKFFVVFKSIIDIVLPGLLAVLLALFVFLIGLAPLLEYGYRALVTYLRESAVPVAL